MRLVSFVLLLTVNAACGIKAPPRPPPDVAQTSTTAHSRSTIESAPR